MARAYHDRESFAAYMREWNPRRTARLRAEVFAILGDECAGCDLDDKRILVFDHVAGDGNNDRVRPSGTRRNTLAMLGRVLRNPERFRVLCHNCNWLAFHYGINGAAPQKSLQAQPAVQSLASPQATLFAEVGS